MKYRVLGLLKHNGVDYKPDDTIELSAFHAVRLAGMNVIEPIVEPEKIPEVTPGIPLGATQLIAIKGISERRALRLLRNNVNNLRDLIEMDAEELHEIFLQTPKDPFVHLNNILGWQEAAKTILNEVGD